MSQEVCTIVGVGPGLGVALARRFGRAGFKIALISRNPSALQEYVGVLNGEGLEAHGFEADTGDSEALTKTFSKIKAQLGASSVLIYNAAVLKAGPGTQLDPQALVEEFKVNVVGALTGVQNVLENMKAEQRGTIIFTGGGLALNPSAQYASLSVGKAGIRSLALSLATELEPAGIHVATVTIGGIVRPNSRFAPERIAEVFWKLHSQAKGEFEREIVFKGQEV